MWNRVTYRTFVWWWLIPAGIVALGALTAYVDLHGPWNGADPTMSPRQAVDSSQQIGVE